MNREQVRFERQLKHSYMSVACDAADLESYEAKMLLKSKIPGTLRCSLDRNEEERLLYDISGQRSFEEYLETQAVQGDDIEHFLHGVDKLLETLEDFLLPESMICLEPYTVFIDTDTGDFSFVCIPKQTEPFAEALTRFLAYLLKKIDYTDDASVILAYTLFQESSKQGYSIQDLLRVVRRYQDRKKQQGETEAALTKAEKSRGAQTDFFETQAHAVENQKNDGAKRCSSAFFEEKSETLENNQFETHMLGENSFGQEHSAVRRKEVLWDDGLIHNQADDEKNRSLYERAPEISDGWESEAQKVQRETKKKRLAEGLAIERGNWNRKLKLILSLALMALIPLGLWFFKGPELFGRMLPVVLVIELAIAVITGLDYLAVTERQ